MEKYLKPLSSAFALVILASMVHVFGTTLLFFSSGEVLEQIYLLILVLFMPLGFIILPHLIAKKQGLYAQDCQVKFHWKTYLVLAGIIFLVNRLFIGSSEYVNQLIISFCEEFLFRFVIYKVLRQGYGYWSSICLASVLFGMVLHLNYPILDNLLLRTPAGFIFAWLTTRFGLHYAVASHWLYNLIVSQVTF